MEFTAKSDSHTPQHHEGREQSPYRKPKVDMKETTQKIWPLSLEACEMHRQMPYPFQEKSKCGKWWRPHWSIASLNPMFPRD